MGDTKKSIQQLYEELKEKLPTSYYAKLINFGDKLFADGEKNQHKRVMKIINDWIDTNCDEMQDEVEELKESLGEDDLRGENVK